MLLGSALQATNNANPQLRNSHPASDIFAYKMMILIVNFYQTPAVWPVSISANLLSSPSDLVLALGLAERIRDWVTKSAPGLVPPHKQVGAIRVMTRHVWLGTNI